MTVEGVELGRHLFYDERLSGDNTMACASCHFPQNAFSDTVDLSLGIDGLPGLRNAMPIFNLAWSERLFWDGRATSLENQALFPVQDELEMHETWSNAIYKLQLDGEYQQKFKLVFGEPGIDSTKVSIALAQFMRSIVSANSPYDEYMRTGNIAVLGPDSATRANVLAGRNIFSNSGLGDCIHCHNAPEDNALVTDFDFKNNGLDASPTDKAYGIVTGFFFDDYKFKTPSLRNLAFTAPYMHDGRFETLDEVLDFYINDVQGSSPNIAIEMFQDDSTTSGQPGAVNLTGFQKMQLKAFLLSLTDYSLLTNPAYADPNP